MENTEFLKSLLGLLGVPFVVGFVQLLKPFITDTRWHPFVAIFFGLAINLTINMVLGGSEAVQIVVSVFQGFMVGLAASGLYDAGRSVINR